MVRVFYQNAKAVHCIRYFTTAGEAGDFLQTVRRPARAVDTTGELVGACYEIPKEERIGRRRWGWWCDPDA